MSPINQYIGKWVTYRTLPIHEHMVTITSGLARSCMWPQSLLTTALNNILHMYTQTYIHVHIYIDRYISYSYSSTYLNMNIHIGIYIYIQVCTSTSHIARRCEVDLSFITTSIIEKSCVHLLYCCGCLCTDRSHPYGYPEKDGLKWRVNFNTESNINIKKLWLQALNIVNVHTKQRAIVIRLKWEQGTGEK